MANVDRGTPFSATQTSTTNATATQAGTTSAIYYVTDISGSTVGKGTISVLGGASGSVVLWSNWVSGTLPVVASFKSPLKGNLGVAVSVFVEGATTSYANIAGYIIFDA